MSDVTIYHNPRCSKSRQTLALLEAQGITPRVVEYLKDPLSLAELKALRQKLGGDMAAMVRSKEAEYAEQGLSADSDETTILQAIANAPKLLERPIVEKGNKAAIGRPPEAVLAIL
jgi:arsenate reductase